MDLAAGGHLSHGFKRSLSGASYNIVNYGVDKRTELIDYECVRHLAKTCRPRLIIAGASAYPRNIDYFEFSRIAAEVDCNLLLDVSHSAGFIAAGITKVPIEPHIILSLTTEKTLCGPRGGLILCDRQLARAIDSAVFPGLQSSCSAASLAGKAAILHQAQSLEFKKFQAQIICNSKVLADGLRSGGLKLLTGGTENHIIVVDLTAQKRTGRDIEFALLDCYILASRQLVPGDMRRADEASGLRFGTTCATIRSISSTQLRDLGALLVKAIAEGVDRTVQAHLLEVVSSITANRLHDMFTQMPGSAHASIA